MFPALEAAPGTASETRTWLCTAWLWRKTQIKPSCSLGTCNIWHKAWLISAPCLPPRPRANPDPKALVEWWCWKLDLNGGGSSSGNPSVIPAEHQDTQAVLDLWHRLHFPGGSGPPCHASDHAGDQGDHLDCSHSRAGSKGLALGFCLASPWVSLFSHKKVPGTRTHIVGQSTLFWGHLHWPSKQLNKEVTTQWGSKLQAHKCLLLHPVWSNHGSLLGMSQSQWKIKIKRLCNPVCKSIQNHKILSKMDYRD